MNHPSPYTLLRTATGLRPEAAADPPEASWTDLRTLAALWENLHQPVPGPAPAAEGPRMRAPAPMHPPIAYPTATQPYDAPTEPFRPRHAYYDAIIGQHKSAAEKAVYVPAALE